MKLVIENGRPRGEILLQPPRNMKEEAQGGETEVT